MNPIHAGHGIITVKMSPSLGFNEFMRDDTATEMNEECLFVLGEVGMERDKPGLIRKA